MSHSFTQDKIIDTDFVFPFEITEGWNKDFTVAGGFVHDVINNRKPIDIDFFVFTRRGFEILFDYFKESETIHHCNSIINIPYKSHLVQIIYHFGETVESTINRFDAEHNKCWFDGVNFMCKPECALAWETKTIRHFNPSQYLRFNRVIKLFLKGYKIEDPVYNLFVNDLFRICKEKIQEFESKNGKKERNGRNSVTFLTNEYYKLFEIKKEKIEGNLYVKSFEEFKDNFFSDLDNGLIHFDYF